MADTPTPDVVALARRRYRDGHAVKAILADTGLTRTALYRCLAGDCPDGSGATPEPIPLRSARVRTRSPGGSRAALIARMWRTAERQVDEIEQRLVETGLERAERESNARTLAVVAKTLRDLAVFDEASKPCSPTARGREAQKDNDDESVPRNIDDLRRALARKLEAFVAGTEDPVSGDTG